MHEGVCATNLPRGRAGGLARAQGIFIACRPGGRRELRIA